MTRDLRCFDCRNRRVRDYGREGTGFISHHEIEWGLIHDRVRVVVVGEFSMGDFISSGTWVVTTGDLKVCFHLLVDMFSFAIRLGVIGNGERQVVVEEFPEFLGKDGGELWTLIHMR